jgi:hypothetical protein
MANWRNTKTAGVYVAHQRRCPGFAAVDARCRCEPSWRVRRHNLLTGKPEWQKPVTKDRSEVLSRLDAARDGANHLKEQAAAGRTFESIGDEWLAGVQAGTIGRRKGRGKAYSATTIADYRRSYENFLRVAFAPEAEGCSRRSSPRTPCRMRCLLRRLSPLRDRPVRVAGDR